MRRGSETIGSAIGNPVLPERGSELGPVIGAVEGVTPGLGDGALASRFSWGIPIEGRVLGRVVGGFGLTFGPTGNVPGFGAFAPFVPRPPLGSPDVGGPPFDPGEAAKAGANGLA